jgi:hypothetical protein
LVYNMQSVDFDRFWYYDFDWCQNWGQNI